MICLALSTEALVSKENRASTSVETLPGTICKISLPNSTSNLSSVASTWLSRSPPCPRSVSAYEQRAGFAYLFLSVLNSNIHQLSILGLLRGSKNERWVGGGILWLVLVDGCNLLVIGYATTREVLTGKVTRVADNDLFSSQKLSIQIISAVLTVPVALS